MDFKSYQEKSKETALYPKLMVAPDSSTPMHSLPFIYPAFGLCGEAGEVMEILKRVVRDHDMKITDDAKIALQKELGDVLWYLSQLCTELGLSLDDVAEKNIEKLQKRKVSNTLHGKGNER